MKIKVPRLRKSLYGLAAIVSAFAAVVSPLMSAKTYAFAQLTERSITMSDATNSGSGTDGTNVTYTVSFKLATNPTPSINAVVIEFCDTSPIIGNSTCGAITGFTAASATVGSASGWTGGGTWAPTNTSSKIVLKNASATNPTAGTAVGFVLNGITNPSAANHSFYARIITYDATTDGDDYTSGNIGTDAVDAGAVALSTTSQINVSGTVAETLTFCTSGTSTTTNGCASGLTAPTLELGTGTPKVLTTTASTGAVYSRIATNAANGATVRMKISNTCGSIMRNGTVTCDIPAIGTTPAAGNNGAFGMRASTAGGLTAQAPYNDASNYGLDNVNAITATGDDVAVSTGVLNNVDTTYTFAASSGTTTPAGVYTAKITMIAVATY